MVSRSCYTGPALIIWFPLISGKHPPPPTLNPDISEELCLPVSNRVPYFCGLRKAEVSLSHIVRSQRIGSSGLVLWLYHVVSGTSSIFLTSILNVLITSSLSQDGCCTSLYPVCIPGKKKYRSPELKQCQMATCGCMVARKKKKAIAFSMSTVGEIM